MPAFRHSIFIPISQKDEDEGSKNIDDFRLPLNVLLGEVDRRISNIVGTVIHSLTVPTSRTVGDVMNDQLEIVLPP